MTRTPKAKPFASNLEYLAATLDYLQTLARKQVAVRQLETERSGMRASRYEQTEREELLGSAASNSAGLQHLLRRLDTGLRHKHDTLNRRTQVTLAAGTPELPLENLARDYSLSEFEKLVLVIILGPDLDSNFSRVMEALSRSHSVEMRTVLDILCAGVEEKIQARRYFIHSGKLLSHGLLNLAHNHEPDSESEFMRMDLELPRRVSSLILGKYDIDDQVVCFSAVVDPEVDLDQVVLPPGKRQEVLDLLMHRDDYLGCRKEWGFDDILSYGKGTILLFSGPSGTGKTMLAHALAKATTHRLMLVDYRKIREYGRHSFDENLNRIFHEARLQHAIILFDEADEMFDDRCGNGIMPTILREFEKLDGIAILATNRRQVLDEALDRRILYRLEFEVPPAELREEIWRRHLPPQAPLAADIDLRALAEDFDFTGGYIKNAVLSRSASSASNSMPRSFSSSPSSSNGHPGSRTPTAGPLPSGAICSSIHGPTLQ
jgi:adenylate kinase family enzyme